MSLTLEDEKEDILLLGDDLGGTSPREASFEDDDWEENALGDWDLEDGEWDDRPSHFETDLDILVAKREKSVESYITEESIDKLMQEAVKPLMDMGFGLSLNQALRIAHCYDWKIRKANDNIQMDVDKVLESCGILLDKKPALL